MDLVGLLLFLVVAAICAWIASALVPGRVPGGFLIAALVGAIGAWVGVALFGNVGPLVAGVAIIPAILGAAIVVFGLYLLAGAFQRREY